MDLKLRNLKEKFSQLIKTRSNPHEIAAGVGIGTFLGVFPIQGFKTPLVALIGGVYKRANIMAIFLTSSIFSLPFTFPFVFFIDYCVGQVLLRKPLQLQWQVFRYMNLRKLGNLAGSLFLGGFVLGVGLSILTYWGTRFFLTHRRGKELTEREP